MKGVKVPDDSFAKDITGLYARLDELKAKVTQLRKERKDPILADLILRNIRAKIHYAEISRDPADMTRIRQQLDEAAAELEDAEGFKERNIKEEIDELVNSSQKER